LVTKEGNFPLTLGKPQKFFPTPRDLSKFSTKNFPRAQVKGKFKIKLKNFGLKVLNPTRANSLKTHPPMGKHLNP